MMTPGYECIARLSGIFTAFVSHRLPLFILKQPLGAVLVALGLVTFLSLRTTGEEIQIGQFSNLSGQSVIARFRQVDTGIFASGRPSEEGVKQLKAMGIKTIVNLERELFEEEPEKVRKEKKWAEELGVSYLRVAMHPFFKPMREEVDKALAVIADPENQPLFVHCDQGKDRTGLIIAAYRIRIKGWSPEEAYEEMKKNGFSHFFLGLLFGWKGFLFEYATGRPS